MSSQDVNVSFQAVLQNTFLKSFDDVPQAQLLTGLTRVIQASASYSAVPRFNQEALHDLISRALVSGQQVSMH